MHTPFCGSYTHWNPSPQRFDCGWFLEPGGVIDEDAERSPFSIFSATDELDDVRKHVEVFNKLIRRYKYLQRSFEETLQNILQYINKWTPEENNKLATAVGFFITSQLASLSVLKTLLKDYLVKDGKTFKVFIRDGSRLYGFPDTVTFCRSFSAVCHCYFQVHFAWPVNGSTWPCLD